MDFAFILLAFLISVISRNCFDIGFAKNLSANSVTIIYVSIRHWM